jgi:hypothetical protein
MSDEAEVQTVGEGVAPPFTDADVDRQQEAMAVYREARENELNAREFTARGQKFHMREAVPAAVLLDLSIVGDKNTPQVEQLRAMRTFIDDAVEESDAVAFHQLLRKASPPIEFEELGKIIEVMVEKISERPTEQPLG